jgi:tetratricopeptide (TPR) repeat protein
MILSLAGALLAWAALFPSACTGQDDASWVGRKIILRRDGVRIGYTNDSGQQIYVADLTDMVYRVLGDEDGWLRVRQRGDAGWFARDDAILLEQAIPYFTGRLRGNSRDALAYAHRGRAWQEKGDLEQALKDYDDAIRTATETNEVRFGLRGLLGRRVVTYPVQASWFRNRGVLYDKKGEHDQAIRDLSEPVRLRPDDPLTYVERGIAYKGKKAYDKAIADHSEAIRLDPEWSSAYFNRANAFKARRDYERALADYSEALRLDPRDADALFNRASTYRATKQYARAARDWSAVIRLEPKDADAYDSLGWLLATCPDVKVRDGEKAVEYAGTACELTDGKSPYCLATLAAAFAEAGRFDLAVKWQKRALESPAYERDEGQAARQRLQLFADRQPYREE